MTTIVIVLTEDYADWETSLLSAAARSFYGATVTHATPGGRPVRSAGGLNVSPDLAVEDIDVGALDALIVCGGTAWQKPGAPDLTSLLRAARDKGKVIGAICDGTVAAARTGILDDVRHTSNGVGHLDDTGYKGKGLYEDVPYAITDGKIVTASGTAPVSFTGAVLTAIGYGGEELNYYLGLHAAQHSPQPAKA